MECVPADRERPHRLPFLDSAQAHRTVHRGHGSSVARPPGHEAWQPGDGGAVEARGVAVARDDRLTGDHPAQAAQAGDQVVHVGHHGVPEEEGREGDGGELDSPAAVDSDQEPCHADGDVRGGRRRSHPAGLGHATHALALCQRVHKARAGLFAARFGREKACDEEAPSTNCGLFALGYCCGQFTIIARGLVARAAAV
uniref:Uncharacterized protein n=2 Tax=Triticum urartu TaxID=4572 RepID=A0A8R7PVM3_TRIUA